MSALARLLVTALCSDVTGSVNAIQQLMGIHRTKTRTGEDGKGERGAGSLRTLLARRSSSGVVAAGSPGAGPMVPGSAQAKHPEHPEPFFNPD